MRTSKLSVSPGLHVVQPRARTVTVGGGTATATSRARNRETPLRESNRIVRGAATSKAGGSGTSEKVRSVRSWPQNAGPDASARAKRKGAPPCRMLKSVSQRNGASDSGVTLIKRAKLPSHGTRQTSRCICSENFWTSRVKTGAVGAGSGSGKHPWTMAYAGVAKRMVEMTASAVSSLVIEGSSYGKDWAALLSCAQEAVTTRSALRRYRSRSGVLQRPAATVRPDDHCLGRLLGVGASR